MEATAEERAKALGLSPNWTAPEGGVQAVTVVLNLSFGLPAVSSKIAEDEVETDADPGRVAAAKKLLVGSEEFRKVTKVRTAVKAWAASVALSNQMVGAGRYLVPLRAVEYIEGKLRLFREFDWEPAVEAFVEAYPDIKRRAALSKEEGGLGSLYDETDYPEAETVGKRCRFTWAYEAPPGAPSSLAEVSEAFFREQRVKAEGAWKDATEDIAIGLRVGLQGLVERMASVLKPGKDGRRKSLRDSLVNELREFLVLFDSRNILDDDDVAMLAARARTLMAGVDNAETLRTDTGTRERVQAGMEALAAEVGRSVVRRRKISFGEED